MIDVSIIIPCYNSYELMSRCLKSLENQTFKNFEVIFVDDCSTDNTLNKLESYLKYSSLTYTILKNDMNSGPGVSRNNGIKFAKGKYVSFMDSDDWYEKDFLELMYNKIIKENVDIVMCDYFRVYSDNRKKRMCPTKCFDRKMTKEDFVALSFDSLCCMLINKDLFNNIKLPQQFNAEDVAVVPVLIANSKGVDYISEALYNYFYREGSLSTSSNDGIEESIIEAYKYIYENIPMDFKEQVEFIGIKVILYSSIICSVQAKYNLEKAKYIVNDFETKHPNWYKNKYITHISASKRLFLYAIKRHNYNLLKILIIIRKILFKVKLA